MPRCAIAAPRWAALVLLAWALPLAWPGASALAQQPARPFPAQALRGSLVVTQPPEVLLNGQPARLSPGARIRGADNMVYLSGSLIGQSLLVHYTLEPLGQLHQVWVLRAEEAAREPWPRSLEEAQRWQFDAGGQTWTRR